MNSWSARSRHVFEARETADASDRLIGHQVAADDARMRLQRLYEKIASGVFLGEDSVLTEIIAKARSNLEKATAALSRARLQAAPSPAIDAERITRFGRLMSERLDEADVNARRGYISSVVNAIEVHDDRICIMDQPDTLSRAVRGQIGTENVRGFVRKWRARTARLRTNCSRLWPTGTPCLNSAIRLIAVSRYHCHGRSCGHDRRAGSYIRSFGDTGETQARARESPILDPVN